MCWALFIKGVDEAFGILVLVVLDFLVVRMAFDEQTEGKKRF